MNEENYKLINLDDENEIKWRRHFVINIINKIWKDENKITKENIVNSFFKSSLTYNMDGTNDEKFEFPSELNNLDSIYDNIEILINDNDQ